MSKHADSVYRRIAADIERQIDDGTLSAGTRLEPERTLMHRFSVERTTLRRALQLLEEKGRIIKKTGVGSFIADPDSAVKNDAAQTEKEAETKTPTFRTLLAARVDLLSAARTVYAMLLAAHHTNIAVVTASPEVFGCTLTASAENALSLEAPRKLAANENAVGDAFRECRRVSEKDRFTAVVTHTPSEARIICRVAASLGIDVPGRLSVVCLDASADEKKRYAGCVFDAQKKVPVMFPDASVGDGMTLMLPPSFEARETFEPLAAPSDADARAIPSFLL